MPTESGLDRVSVYSSWPTSLGGCELYVRYQQTIRTLHPVPVIFVLISAQQTDLIVLPIGAESRPGELMGAHFSAKSLPEFHFCPLRVNAGQIGSAIC
jgi:hypothetical protein